MTTKDTGPRRRLADTQPVARLVESSGFRLTMGVSVVGLFLSVAPVLIYMGRIDATIEVQGQEIAQQGKVIDAITETLSAHGTALATLNRDIEHVSTLQDEVRETLRNPEILRPDPWTSQDDAQAMREFEQRLRREAAVRTRQ